MEAIWNTSYSKTPGLSEEGNLWQANIIALHLGPMVGNIHYSFAAALLRQQHFLSGMESFQDPNVSPSPSALGAFHMLSNLYIHVMRQTPSSSCAYWDSCWGYLKPSWPWTLHIRHHYVGKTRPVELLPIILLWKAQHLMGSLKFTIDWFNWPSSWNLEITMN